jgi:hypothetical protein
MGWTYNTPDDVPNEGPQITAVAIALTAMSLVVLLLRFYVRVCMIKAIGAGMYCYLVRLLADLEVLDDYVLIITWVRQHYCAMWIVHN